jgi:glycine cleavage system aminomethyltransferase T
MDTESRTREAEEGTMNHIMDIEVEKIADERVCIKFVAFVGETGPELIMPEKMASDLFELLKLTLGK